MSTLVRSQILLDAETKQDLVYLSEITNESISSLVRRFVAGKVKAEKRVQTRRRIKSKKMSGAQALLKMAEAAEKIEKKYGTSGPTDGSINHDYYLYGAPKKQPA